MPDADTTALIVPAESDSVYGLVCVPIISSLLRSMEEKSRSASAGSGWRCPASGTGLASAILRIVSGAFTSLLLEGRPAFYPVCVRLVVNLSRAAAPPGAAARRLHRPSTRGGLRCRRGVAPPRRRAAVVPGRRPRVGPTRSAVLRALLFVPRWPQGPARWLPAHRPADATGVADEPGPDGDWPAPAERPSKARRGSVLPREWCPTCARQPGIRPRWLRRRSQSQACEGSRRGWRDGTRHRDCET